MSADWDKADQALMSAVIKGSSSKVKALVQKKKVNPVKICPSTQDTAAHRAVTDGKLKIFSLILEALPDVNAVDGKGRTLLHVAAYSGKEDIVKRLLEVRAVQPGLKDAEGLNALHCASAQGHIGCVRLLITSLNANSTDNAGRTALFHAAQRGGSSICRLLLEAGANINATDSRRRTALMTSVRHSATLEYLVSMGADMGACDEQGHDVMWHATQANDQPTLFYLARLPSVGAGGESDGGRESENGPGGSGGMRGTQGDSRINSQQGSEDRRPAPRGRRPMEMAVNEWQGVNSSIADSQQSGNQSQGRPRLDSTQDPERSQFSSSQSLHGNPDPQRSSSTSLDSNPPIELDTRTALSKQKSQTINDLRDLNQPDWATNTARSRSEETDVSRSSDSRTSVRRLSRHSSRNSRSSKNRSNGGRSDILQRPGYDVSGSDGNLLSEELKQELSQLRGCYSQLLELKDSENYNADPVDREKRSKTMDSYKRRPEYALNTADAYDTIPSDSQGQPLEGTELYFRRRLETLERENSKLRTEIKMLSRFASSRENGPLSDSSTALQALHDPVCEKCGTELIPDRMRTLCAPCNYALDQSNVEKRGHAARDNTLPEDTLSDQSDPNLSTGNGKCTGEAAQNQRRKKQGEKNKAKSKESQLQSNGRITNTALNSDHSSRRSSKRKMRKRSTGSKHGEQSSKDSSSGEDRVTKQGRGYIRQLEGDTRRLRRELSEMRKEMQRRNDTFPHAAVTEQPLGASEAEPDDNSVKVTSTLLTKKKPMLNYDWKNTISHPNGLVLSELMEENRALKEELERRLSEDRRRSATIGFTSDADALNLSDKNNNLPQAHDRSSNTLDECHPNFEAEAHRLLEERISSLQLEKSELVKENRWLQRDLENLRSVSDGLLKEKSEISKNNEELFARNSTLKAEKQRCDEDLAKLQWELKGLASDKRKAEERIRDLSDDIKDLEQVKQEYQRIVDKKTNSTYNGDEDATANGRLIVLAKETMQPLKVSVVQSGRKEVSGKQSDSNSNGEEKMGATLEPGSVSSETMQQVEVNVSPHETFQTKRSELDMHSSLSDCAQQQGEAILSITSGARRKGHKEDRPSSELTRLKAENSRLLAQLESLEQEMNSRNKPLGKSDNDKTRSTAEEERSLGNKHLMRNENDRTENASEEVGSPPSRDVNRDSGIFSLPWTAEPNRLSFEFEAEKLAFEREMKKLRRANDGLRTDNDRLEKELNGLREDFKENSSAKSKAERYLVEFRGENEKLVNEKRQLELKVRELENAGLKLTNQPGKSVGGRKVDRLNRELQRAIEELETPRDAWCLPELQQPVPAAGLVEGQRVGARSLQAVDSGCQTDDSLHVLLTSKSPSLASSSPDTVFSVNTSSSKETLVPDVTSNSLERMREESHRKREARRGGKDRPGEWLQNGEGDTNLSDSEESMKSKTEASDVDALQSELQELRERQREHESVVGTYRSHLLAAIHGNLDPEVHDVLLRMIGVQ